MTEKYILKEKLENYLRNIHINNAIVMFDYIIREAKTVRCTILILDMRKLVAVVFRLAKVNEIFMGDSNHFHNKIADILF